MLWRRAENWVCMQLERVLDFLLAAESILRVLPLQIHQLCPAQSAGTERYSWFIPHLLLLNSPKANRKYGMPLLLGTQQTVLRDVCSNQWLRAPAKWENVPKFIGFSLELLFKAVDTIAFLDHHFSLISGKQICGKQIHLKTFECY